MIRPGVTAGAPGYQTLTTGVTDAGTGSFLSLAGGTVGTDRDGVTWILGARMDAIPAATEFLLAKYTSAEMRIFCDATNFQLRSVGGGVHLHPHRPEDVGRVFWFALAKSNAEQKAFSWARTKNAAVQIGPTITAGITVETNGSRLAIGSRSGDLPANEGKSFSFIGAAVWDAYLSEADLTTILGDAYRTGRIDPTIVANAEGVWNAAGGWLDEVASADMAKTENTPGDLVDVTERIRGAGDQRYGVLMLGQSVMAGSTTTELDWPSPYDATDAVEPVTQIFQNVGSEVSTVWGALGPTGDNQMGPEQSLGRSIKGDPRLGGRTVYVIRHAQGATDLANEWEISPVEGSEWADADTTITNAVAALDAHDTIKIEGVIWYQGQADANNAGEAAAYGANLAAWLEDLDGYLDAAGIRSPSICYVVCLISDNSSRAFKATLKAGQLATVAARSDTVWVNTDAIPMPDGLHPQEDGQIEIGLAGGLALLNRENTTAAAP